VKYLKTKSRPASLLHRASTNTIKYAKFQQNLWRKGAQAPVVVAQGRRNGFVQTEIISIRLSLGYHSASIYFSRGFDTAQMSSDF